MTELPPGGPTFKYHHFRDWGFNTRNLGGHKRSANNKVYESSKLSVNIGESQSVRLASLLSQAPSPYFNYHTYPPGNLTSTSSYSYSKYELISFPNVPALLPSDLPSSVNCTKCFQSSRKQTSFLPLPVPDHPAYKAVARLSQV